MDITIALFTAFVGIFLYWLHKKDEKKRAAIILLSEIQSAEFAINQIRTVSAISDFITIMSEGSWKKLRYFFVTDLDRDDIELISNFYNSCLTTEQQIQFIQNTLNVAMVEKMRITQEKLADFSLDSSSREEFEEKQIEKLGKIYWPNENYFVPSAPTQKILSFINQIQFITTTTTGQKLKKIANAPWWKIFI